MAQVGTTYGVYRPAADKQYDTIVIPANCTEPLKLTFTPASDVAWSSRWYLEFSDGKYIRAVERFQKWPGLDGIAKKMAFAYHYGDVTRRNPDDNLPDYLPDDQVDIRIDNSGLPTHLHFNKQNPHIPQSQVDGLDLESVDMFVFVKNIFKHRETKKALDSVFKFKIR
jgi:hypothetical protein